MTAPTAAMAPSAVSQLQAAAAAAENDDSAVDKQLQVESSYVSAGGQYGRRKSGQSAAE